MNCIVSAGPTYEELDAVRRLTNFSTGRLGSELANFLVQRGHRVELLLGHYSTWRGQQKAQHLQVFSTTADLRRRFQALSSSGANAIFHAAAVSDFGFGKIWSRKTDGQLVEVAAQKFSTHGEALLAELLPTPKILRELRGWFPSACIVGWKYEVDGARSDVIAKAEQQIKENNTEACVANGKAYGKGFGLVTAPSRCIHMPDTEALFQGLEHYLRSR